MGYVLVNFQLKSFSSCNYYILNSYDPAALLPTTYYNFLTR